MSRSDLAAALAAPAGPLEARLRTARALAARHRRLAAALCAGTAVLATVSALTPATPAAPGEGAGGGPPALVLPAGAGTAAVGDGRVAVTVRLVDPAGVLLARPGAHVEVIGGAPAGAAGQVGGDAVVLAADAVVLAVPRATGGAGPGPEAGVLDAAPTGSGGPAGVDGVLVLSVSPSDAHRLAGAAGVRPLSLAVALPAA